MGYVFVCMFRRTKNSPTEWGFMINEEVVIDREGKIPETIHAISTLPHRGAFELPKEDE